MDTTPLEYCGQYTSCKVFTQDIEHHAADVLAYVADTVEVVNKLRPIYNFKAGGEPE